MEIHIVRDFSKTPGFRFRTEGPFSGEQFREEHLEPLFIDLQRDDIITVVLDGVAGYATSFLEEAFGGLARKFTAERCLQRLRFVSGEEPLLIQEIIGYIKGETLK